eukprot:EG_transcript_2564
MCPLRAQLPASPFAQHSANTKCETSQPCPPCGEEEGEFLYRGRGKGKFGGLLKSHGLNRRVHTIQLQDVMQPLTTRTRRQGGGVEMGLERPQMSENNWMEGGNCCIRVPKRVHRRPTPWPNPVGVATWTTQPE